MSVRTATGAEAGALETTENGNGVNGVGVNGVNVNGAGVALSPAASDPGCAEGSVLGAPPAPAFAASTARRANASAISRADWKRPSGLRENARAK